MTRSRPVTSIMMFSQTFARRKGPAVAAAAYHKRNCGGMKLFQLRGSL